MMSALRDTVGPDVDIMVDFHGRPASVAAALQYIDVLAPYEPLFCEEPVQPGDTEALRQVADRSPMPIAAGERLVGLREFLPVLAAKAIHVAQPDLNHTGGLLEGKRIAALADAEGVGVAPHNPNGPIAGAAALHFAVSTPNFVIQEEMSGAVSWYDDVVRTPMRRVGSHWQVPTEPGSGRRGRRTRGRQTPVPAGDSAQQFGRARRRNGGGLVTTPRLRPSRRRPQRDAAPGRVRAGHLRGPSRRSGPPRFASRVIVTTPGRAALGDRFATAIGERCAGMLPEAVSQVPIELVGRAAEKVAGLGADCVVAIGGGAATGLCKGIAYETGLPIVAVPTTYSGSEMTGFCGMTSGGVKRMHESLAMRPRWSSTTRS